VVKELQVQHSKWMRFGDKDEEIILPIEDDNFKTTKIVIHGFNLQATVLVCPKY